MNIRRTISTEGFAVVLALLLTSAMHAQPTCSINIGPDTVICQGGTANLTGPSGYGNYLWSTGAISQNISFTTAGDYWCQVSYPSGNLVTNGDFSSGNTGFTSQFTYSPTSVQQEGIYTVGTNAHLYHTQFQGTGNGNFLIGNGGYGSWSNNQKDVWCQTIPCCPGQTYTLSFLAQTLSNALPARAIWLMDGVLVAWPDMTFPAYGAGWQQYNNTWTAGPGQTSVMACISLTSADGVGDDFGIDNISISGTIILRDTVHVSVTPRPNVNLGNDFTLCNGEAADLNATVPGGTYLWQDGSTGPGYHVTSPGNFSVTVTANNCSNSDNVFIAYNPLPVVQLGPDTTLCAGSTLSLSAFSPGSTFLWQNGATAANFTISAPGLYWVEVTRNNCSARDSVTISYDPLPVVSLGNDTTICAGSPLTLDATVVGGTYLWQDGSLGPTFPVVNSGNYHVTVDLNGCTAQDAIQVTVTPLPVADIGPDTTVCPGSVVTFDATTADGTYLWDNNSMGPTLTSTIPGNYSVQVTVNGCSASDAAILSNFNLQTVNLGPDRTICAGETATIGTTVPGATYLWNTGAITDSVQVSAAGAYWVDASLNGCAARDSINVAVTLLPAVNIGPDLQLCPAAQATLNATLPGATYLWSNGALTPTISVGAGTWSVDVTTNGCTASDAATISNLTPPVVDLGADTVLCPSASITLNAGPYGTDYLWNTGATNQSITVSSATTVSVTVTDAHGCSNADAITISYASPIPVSLGPDISVCAGEPVTLDATTAGTSGYLWNDGSTNAILTTTNAGSYIVAVSQGYCASVDTINIQTVQAPSITLGNDTALCPGETFNLHVSSAGATLVWQDGSTAGDLLVQVAGDYWVAATNTTGCTDTAFVHVGYLTANAFALGPDTVLCSGETLLLNAGLPGGTTAWSGAITSSASSIQAQLTGTYIATTTVMGCSFTDSIHISVVSPPTVDLGADQSLCAGSALQLTASAPSLLWDDGSTANTRTIHQGGTYWVQATENGCSAADSVTVIDIPLPFLELGPDTGLCASGLITLDATVPGGSYLWNDGNTAPQRMVGPGEWIVQVIALGCSTSDSVLINALPSPLLSLPQDTTLCTGTVWTIDAAQPGSTYLWSTGAVTSSLTVGAPGTYGVTVDRGGCTASAQVEVAYVDLSTFSLGPDTALCPGTTIQLFVDMPGVNVVWQDGSTASQRSVNAEGTYQANISVDGCTAQASVHVGITPLPEATLGADLSLCVGDTLWLRVQPGTAQVEWSTGTNVDSLRVTTSGNYSVTMALDGCISTDTTHVTFLPIISALDLGPDRGICPGMPITLDATIAGATYTWNDGSHLPELQVQDPGIYQVLANGPCIHASDTITFTEGACTPVVHVPNAFTPDGDDINDRFTPVVFEPIRQWSFMVFDRWGERIFTTDKPGDGWDGKMGGKEAPVGVYVWALHFEAVTDEGVVQELERGSVTLVR